MSDTARKVFPAETVLALLMGNKDIDVKELIGYISGRSITCCCCANVIAPMASGWLAGLYPAFLDLEWDKNTPWADFVAKTSGSLGNNISLTPMSEAKLAAVNEVINCFTDLDATIKAQNSELAALQKQVEELAPYRAKAQELEKKTSQLEAKVKSLTTDANNLRKEALPFKGKMAVDQQELENIIKDAIKTNLKGLVIGGAAGVAAAGAEAVAEEAPEAANDGGPAADFGFGSSGANNDGFGF